MSNFRNANHPILIFIRGLPGSGKSYIAHALQKAIEEQTGKGTTIMLDPDATDYDSKEYIEHSKSQSAEGVDPILHPYRYLRAQAYSGIASHKIVIWNQPFTNLEIFNKMVANLNLQASEHHTTLPILVVEVEIDSNTAKKRVEKRKQAGGHGPSDNTFARFTQDYKSFADEGYTTVTVQGEDEVSLSVSVIIKALEDLNQA